jgi:hypothetical protein
MGRRGTAVWEGWAAVEGPGGNGVPHKEPARVTRAATRGSGVLGGGVMGRGPTQCALRLQRRTCDVAL